MKNSQKIHIYVLILYSLFEIITIIQATIQKVNKKKKLFIYIYIKKKKKLNDIILYIYVVHNKYNIINMKQYMKQFNKLITIIIIYN